MLGKPAIWVYGRADLTGRVQAGLREAGRRAHLASGPDDLARLRPGRGRILILTDPPEGPRLLEDLAKRLGRRGRWGGGASLRVILLHPSAAPPALPGSLSAPDPAGGLRLETVSLEDRAARVLLARWPLHFGMDPGFGQRPHLLLAGFAAPAQALLVQALRLIHYDESPPRVTVACATPDPCSRAFAGAYPQAGQVAEIRWSSLDLPGLAEDPPITQAFVCTDPPAEGLALALARALAGRIAGAQGCTPPIHLEMGDGHAAAPIEDWDGQLYPFSYLAEVCRPRVLLDGAGDRLAQTIHDYYRDSIAAQGRDPATEPAGQPWETLAESYRDANRHQADHLEAKLAATDCRAVPEERVESFAFAPLETERLAVIEHLRWAADRYLDGWTYAPKRDNATKRHPQLIPYPDLSEPMKDLDRFAVRGVPALLARSGQGVVRMLILGLPEPDPDCPGGRVLERLVDRVFRRLVARYPDRSLVLATTLADPRARLVARRALAWAGAGLFLLCSRSIGDLLATQPDVAARRELLALAARAERRIPLCGAGELERWLAERAEILLALGARSPAAAARKRVLIDPVRERLDWSFEY